MKEGYVSLNNIKMVICGPPAVGKTAFKDLLLNKPPPLEHDSTPIAARPIQAIERIAARCQVWEEVTTKDLLHMLSDALKAATIPSHELESSFNSVTPLLTHEVISSQKNKTSTEPSSLDDTTAPLVVSSQKNKTSTEPSSLDNTTAPLVVSSSVAQASSLLHVPNDVATFQPTIEATTPQPTREVSKILKQIADAKGSQKLLEATWIHLLDSGGQPQFTDLLRMFVRDNSLYIIAMKVTESLHDKPKFVYSINGEPISAPKDLTMTNFQIIENIVRSVVAASRDQKRITSKPAFAIIATHCDQLKFKRLFGLDEKLKEKDAKIQSRLSEFLNFFIFYNRDTNELVFPVDNLCWWNRKKISANIRSCLSSSRSDIIINNRVPIRWYVFDLNMKEEASKEKHGMISLQSCYNIGYGLNMNKDNVNQCLKYLDSMRLCIYYPGVLPHVVFTSPQFLIDCLSNIVRVSFIDDLWQVLPEEFNLSSDNIINLKENGIFDNSLLDNLGLTFIPNLFTKNNLLSLLEHFHIVSPISADTTPETYFMPTLLPPETLTDEEKKDLTKGREQLIIASPDSQLKKVHAYTVALIITSLYIVCCMCLTATFSSCRDCFHH